MLSRVIALTLLVAFVIAQAAKPVWPARFTAQFNETEHTIFTGHVTGKYWYDAAKGLNRVDRDNGKLDRYCGTVYPFVDTKCSHLVVDGKRYLDFPDKKYCCMCCDASKGCGILSPSWVDGAEFIGFVEYQNQNVSKWDKKGLQSNFYYQTVDKNLPAGVDQVPNDYISFQLNTYSTDPIPDSIFTVPDYCRDSCPTISICSVLNKH